jgi:glycolate oxidase
MEPRDRTAVLRRLVALLPAGRVLAQAEQLAAYESDGLTAFHQRPLAVVVPETQQEVIATVRFCRDEKIPFVARGSGTSLSGGSLPVADGIVITLNRLNKIRRLDPAQRIAVVEPGVINLAVTAAAQPYGLHFAATSPSTPAARTA